MSRGWCAGWRGPRRGGGEAAVRDFCGANGVAWTLLRPTLIYAEGHDQNVTRLAGMIRKLGVLPLSGQGAGLRPPVHADAQADFGWNPRSFHPNFKISS